MANTYAILNELLRSNSEIVSFQRRKINELATRDFPFYSADLISVLKKINKESDTIYENIQKTFESYQLKFKDKQFTPSTDPYESLLADLDDNIKLVWIINAIVHFMEHSSHENVSQSTVFLIDRLTRDFGVDSRFLLTPIFENNFTYRNIGEHIGDLIRDAFPNAKDILEKFPQNFSVISFPSIHRDNIIPTILLAHEVGHFFSNIKNLESRIYPEIKLDYSEFTNYINETILSEKEQISDQKTRTLVADNWEFLWKSIQSWIKELLADAIGFRLTGPVFVFMLSETLLSISHHSEMTDEHPPPSMRIKIILEQIEKKDFLKNLEGEHKKNLEELLEQISDFINTPSLPQENFLLQFVSNTVFTVIDKINEIVDEETKNFQYKNDQFTKDVPILMKKMDELIPPCEMGKESPADVISILNAGIIYKMTWMKNNKYNIENSIQRKEFERIINSLVLKAIELSVLNDMMLTHKPKDY